MSKQPDPLCNESIFNAFFKEHVRPLRNYIYFRFGDESAAEDVTQEAFVNLWKNCSKVKLDTAKSYLFTIAKNLSTSLKRHEQVKLKYEQQAVKIEHTSEDPEFIILENEFMEKLNAAISALPDKQREVFLMNRIEKLKYREIAEIQGVTQKAIEKLMHKALLKLREEIEIR